MYSLGARIVGRGLKKILIILTILSQKFPCIPSPNHVILSKSFAPLTQKIRQYNQALFLSQRFRPILVLKPNR